MENQTFWKTAKPYFSDKGSNSRPITSLENESIPHKDSSLTDINGITNFDNHTSIKKIKESFSNIVSGDFNFQKVSREDVKKEIINLNVKKSSTNGSIPATILKQCVDEYLPFLTKAINHAITENIFPEQLKKSEVIPLHKKKDHLRKENYRP